MSEQRAGLRPLEVVSLGAIQYADCWELQKRTAEAVGQRTKRDTLLLLEHPHTYTCGRRGGRDHILIGEEELDRQGITVLDVDRGGDVTYHGPGQFVAYPIINIALEGGRIDYHAYVRTLEQVLIKTLAHYAISSFTIPGFTGAWVLENGAEAKVAAIGVKVDGRGVTSHGIALNVSTDLRYFSQLVPCGITDKSVTSLQKLVGREVSMQEVQDVFTQEFSAAYGFIPVPSFDPRIASTAAG